LTSHILKIQKGQLNRNKKYTLKRHLKRNGGSTSVEHTQRLHYINWCKDEYAFFYCAYVWKIWTIFFCL